MEANDEMNDSQPDDKNVNVVDEKVPEDQELSMIKNKEVKKELQSHLLKIFQEADEIGFEKAVQSRSIVAIFSTINDYLKLFDHGDESDASLLLKLSRFLKWNKTVEDEAISYLSVFFIENSSQYFKDHLGRLANVTYQTMIKLRADNKTESQVIDQLVMSLHVLTHSLHWSITQIASKYNSSMKPIFETVLNELTESSSFYENFAKFVLSGFISQNRIDFSFDTFSSIVSLSNRILSEKELVEERLKPYIMNILTLPGFTYNTTTFSSVSIGAPIFKYIVDYLYIHENLDAILKELNESLKLIILANIVQMGANRELELATLIYPKLIKILGSIVESIKTSKEHCKEELSHWHGILGYISEPISTSINNTISVVKLQLQNLWSDTYLQAAFITLFNVENYPSAALNPISTVVPDEALKTSKEKSTRNSRMSRIFNRIKNSNECAGKKSGERESGSKRVSEYYSSVGEISKFYNSLLSTFKFSRIEILSGISFGQNSIILTKLWELVAKINVNEGDEFWETVLVSSPPFPPINHLFLLFAETLAQYVCLIDDRELFEEIRSMSMSKISSFASFLNNLCFRLLVNADFELKTSSLFNQLKKLLYILQQRDFRKRFCPTGHWTLDTQETKKCISEIQKGKLSQMSMLILNEMPQTIPEEFRVVLLKKYISNEKLSSSVPSGITFKSTIIKICRRRIIEDGYSQLSILSKDALKGPIRVRYIDENGRDEPAVEEETSFSEFIKEIIIKVIQRSKHLFKYTENQHYYPSSCSKLHKNHLTMFEFIGKLIGKALYEGVAIEIIFAHFFLAEVLNHEKETKLIGCTVEEIKSINRDLYNSLLYIKLYAGNVEELNLTFSEDIDVKGVKEKMEFFPRGSHVAVNNNNKNSYIYMRAHHHLYSEIHKQTESFINGFYSIISFESVKMLSPNELQRLLSGENLVLDMDDLRKNTKYYGIFTDDHPLINWLWDILINDFSEVERQLFLKFVTSSSKPPLHGFSKLDPPFAIRSVSMSTEQGNTPSLGSSLRGLLTPTKSTPVGMAVPTASTFSHVLNLPIYPKRRLLKEKLKHCISLKTPSS